jgi:hypothetical protein
MHPIVTILRAAHCRSTHHYFAIDGLFEAISDDGKKLARLLLANFSRYLEGAKDPDTRFKDFENHVVHVSDGYWGGAAKTAEKWLDKVYRQLKNKAWSEASYSIGVLSHYFTDPWMPLHTGQTPREAIYHRPLEWSVCCAYEEILSIGLGDETLGPFQLPASERWLTDAIHAGATLSHRFYESILNDYDLCESAKQPALALGDRSKQELARIFIWVLSGWGAAIDRMAEQSKASLPELSLTLPTIVASIQVPIKKIASKVKNAEQRKEVEKILDEFHNTGKVTKSIPEEQKVVWRVRQDQPKLCPSVNDIERAVSSINLQSVEPKSYMESPGVPSRIDTSPREDKEPVYEELTSSNEGSVAKSSQKSLRARTRTSLGSSIVDAPAIGPKTAARLNAIGIHTIADLLDADPAALANQLDSNWITPRTIELWIIQARLVCQIENLTAVGAGLMSLAGIRTAEDVRRMGAALVYKAILAAVASSEGKRILRDKPPPEIERVERWVRNASKANSLKETSELGPGAKLVSGTSDNSPNYSPVLPS